MATKKETKEEMNQRYIKEMFIDAILKTLNKKENEELKYIYEFIK